MRFTKDKRILAGLAALLALAVIADWRLGYFPFASSDDEGGGGQRRRHRHHDDDEQR